MGCIGSNHTSSFTRNLAFFRRMRKNTSNLGLFKIGITTNFYVFMCCVLLDPVKVIWSLK